MVSAGASSDAKVVEASLREPSRFGILYDRYAADVHRYAYRRVGPDAADDVVAQTFLVAFERRKRYDLGVTNARPWLFGIATREISRLRRTERTYLRTLARVPRESDTEGPADRVVASVASRAAHAELAGALAGLSARDRSTLLLHAWGALSYEETALALKIPVGTVRSRLNRARRRLRAALGGLDPTAEN